MNLLDEYRNIRKYIEPEIYEELVAQERKKTRIGFCVIGWSVDDRIEELQSLEDKFGFVFLGEKAWLSNFKETGEHPIYSSWLENIVFKKYEDCITIINYNEDKRYWPEKVFQIVIDTNKYVLSFKDSIISNYIYPDKLILNVTSKHNSVSLPHLVVAYELIHDFEYILNAISKTKTDDMLIESIDIVSKDDPRAWIINQDSFGCVWDMPVRGRN